MWGYVVDIATRLRDVQLKNRGSIPDIAKKVFFKYSTSALGSTHPTIQYALGHFPRGQSSPM